MLILLFFLGSAVGSFLNVVALRYDPDKVIFSNGVLSGRSRCPKCKRTLRWFELVPIVSFLVQGGRCLRCNEKISSQYVIVEVLSGLLFVLVPAFVPCLLPTANCPLQTAPWLLIFLILLLISLIDIRLMIIPDELQVTLGFLGLSLLLFGGADPNFEQRLFAALAAALFFGLLVFGTRGRGMGIGDVKLASALGFIFGPFATFFAISTAFIIGAIVGVYLILQKHKNLKSAIPFGPFLAFGALAAFFLGEHIWIFIIPFSQ